MPRWIVPSALLFLLCLAGGFVSRFDNATTNGLIEISLTSGIALAGLLVWGLRFWPAASLGCGIGCVLKAFTTYGTGSPAGQVLVVAFLMTVVYTLQFVLGTILLQKWFRQPIDQVRLWPIMLFFLIAGPIHTLVSSLLGPLLLVVAGFWPAEHAARSMLDWWLSEMTGGYLFAIIFLCFFGQPGGIWRPRRVTVALPLLCAVMLLVAFGVWAPPGMAEFPQSARLNIAILCGAGLVSLTVLLLVLTGQSARIAEESVRIREALVSSEARLAMTQGIAQIGIWEWNPVNDTVGWSDELYRLVGYEPGAFNPTFERFLQCVHPDDRAMLHERQNAAIANQRPYMFDFRVVRPDGTIRVLHVDTRIDRDASGVPVLWRGIDQDVTDRVNAETEQRRLDDRLRTTQRWESLGQLAGGVAHDFNNLMTGVCGNAMLAREQLPPDSPLQEMLKPIEEAAHHAASLCQQLLTFAGKSGTVRGPLDVQGLIAETHDLLRMGLPKAIDLRIENAPCLPPVEGDRSQLKQVLLNLVWNAAEAISQDGGAIEIRTGSSFSGCCSQQGAGHFCATLTPGRYVWLEVRDTGCGIPADLVPRIFDPFVTTKDMGRGLGLSAVAGIVRAHGGVVCVTSRTGIGTSLRVYLAAIDDESGTRTPPPVINTPRQIAHPNPRLAAVARLVENA